MLPPLGAVVTVVNSSFKHIALRNAFITIKSTFSPPSAASRFEGTFFLFQSILQLDVLLYCALFTLENSLAQDKLEQILSF